MRRQIRGATALLALCVGFAVRAFAADAPIDAALKDPSRPPYDLVRDAARKPAAMLAFAGVKQGQVIADFMPGGGYYTRLLAKAVAPAGRLYAVVPGGTMVT